jgi:hypothetical protein
MESMYRKRGETMAKVIDYDFTNPNPDPDFERLVEYLRERQGENNLCVANPKRVAEMDAAYKKIRTIILDFDDSATFKIEESGLSASTSYIMIRTSTLLLDDADLIKMFSEVLNTCDTFEIVPVDKSQIEIGIGFSGLMRTYKN